MKRVGLLLILTIFLNACTEKVQSGQNTGISSKEIIYIVPLGKTNPQDVKLVARAIHSFYHVQVSINNTVPWTDDLLAKSKTRYDAAKVLSKFNTRPYYQLFLCSADIAVKNIQRHSDEWGVFGLGLMPGKIAIVSTFRLKRKASRKLFEKRLIKVCLHEVGHNLGLPHCTSNSFCLMNDARGTISQVDKEKIELCSHCYKRIN